MSEQAEAIDHVRTAMVTRLAEVTADRDRLANTDPSAKLTADELTAVGLAADLWNLLCRIVGNGPSRAGDMAELAASIHTIQQAILSLCAARAYPERFRLLGEVLIVQDHVTAMGQ